MSSLKLRILFGDLVLGPGKAELLARIGETGSIAAAGRQMQMSYKRAWMLVEEMNAAFRDPLVTSARGGAGGGGAQLTEAGLAVLRLYGLALAQAEEATATPVAQLAAMLADGAERSDGK